MTTTKAAFQVLEFVASTDADLLSFPAFVDACLDKSIASERTAVSNTLHCWEVQIQSGCAEFAVRRRHSRSEEYGMEEDSIGGSESADSDDNME
jgi:hypothetical protein